MSLTKITTLFLDIGGVLLTNGWDRTARNLAAGKFGLDMSEMDERHHLTFDTYEAGKLTLDEYLARVVFYEERSFTPGQFREFMFAQSKSYPDMIELIRGIKARHGLRVAAVNNEGRELSIHRIKTFNLGSFIDCFVTSSFVHFRKPDADIYRMALDVVQAAPPEVLYIDDRAMFVDVARGLGINGIHHASLQTTKAALEAFGLSADR
jgi:putative hydrolase of the HAD superfamily